MPPIGLSHMNCVAAQGKLWIPAAWDGEKNIEFIYVYDPATNTWGTKTAMPLNRRRGSAAVMVSPDEKKIYVSHGTTGGHEWEQNQNKATSLPYLDVYDIATDTWTELSSSAPNVRDHVGGAIVGGGKLVCVAGGRHGGEYGFPAVEPTDCFNLDTKVWEPKPPLFPARSRAQYVTTCDGKLMVAGGEYRGTTFNDVNIFDGTNWTRYANLPNNGRHSGGLAVDCTCNQMHLVSGLVTSYGDAVDKTMSTYYPDGVKTDCSSGPKLPDPGNSAPSPPLPVGCELPRVRIHLSCCHRPWQKLTLTHSPIPIRFCS
jgi:N-acetylneuraminic acid mutarotase